jgi:hypothetical protein
LVLPSGVNFSLFLRPGRFNGIEVEEGYLHISHHYRKWATYHSRVLFKKRRQINRAFDKIANASF